MLGHGAYLGPDYTAEALHWMTEAIRRQKAPDYEHLGVGQKAAIDAEIAAEMKENRYRDETLTFTAHQAAAWNTIAGRYAATFAGGQPDRALPKGALLPAAEGGGDPAHDREAARELAAFVTWTAWLSAANRPDAPHSYTNNWPYDKVAGNTATAGSMMWSAVSVATLLLFLALILFVWQRYQLAAQDIPFTRLNFNLDRLPLTPSQRAAAKYFAVAWFSSWCSLCWAANWLTITPIPPVFSDSTYPVICPSTLRAPGTCNWPSSGSPPPGSAWAFSLRPW